MARYLWGDGVRAFALVSVLLILASRSQASFAQGAESATPPVSEPTSSETEDTAAEGQSSGSGEEKAVEGSAAATPPASETTSPETESAFPEGQNRNSSEGETTDSSAAVDRGGENVEQVPVISLPQPPPEPVPVPVPVPSDSTVLDDIVVTAQRKVQSVYDVPIAMTVVDDKFLAQEGITDLTELSRYVANTKIRADLAFGQGVSIRGFTKQAGNGAFEQAVGLLVDGVSYNDNDYFMLSLLDVERVEILRGPQGTLLGKNTTGGLLNITTKEPTDQFEGFVNLESGDVGRKLLAGAIGGPVPLLDGLLNFRLALSSDARDGVFGNTTGEIMQGVPLQILNRDRSGFRAKLEAPDLFGSRLGIQYEQAEAAYTGTGLEIVTIPNGNENFLRQYDPKLDVEPGNFIGSVDYAGDTSRLVNKMLARWTYQLGDWSLDAIAAYGNVSGAVTGGDATPAPLLTFLFDTSKPQTSYEFIASTPSLFGALDLTAGVVWQRRELDLLGTIELDPAAFGAWIGSASSPTTPPKPPPTPPEERESSTLLFSQLSDTLAGYGQVTWPFADHWSLIGGVRVAEEKKTADWNRTVSENSVLLTQRLGYEEFTAARERSEVLSMPKIALQYRPSRNISLFAHWTQGFRSGGFNAGATGPGGLDFEPETLTEWAVNAKTQFFDGLLRLNLGLFRNELEDFQLLTVDPESTATATVNAGSALAQGVEADLTWAPWGWLSVFGAFGYNDAVFTDFKYGPCTTDRVNTDGDSDTRCDHTGKVLPGVPIWAGSLTPALHVPLEVIPGLGGIGWFSRQGIELQGGVSVEYSDDQTTGLPGDERFTQPAYYRLNAHFGFGSVASRWSFRVTGDNLTNEAVNRGRLLVNSSSAVVQQLEPPRLVYGQLRWDF